MLGTVAQLTGGELPVPGFRTFLAAVLTFATLAVVLRTVSWVDATQLDRVLLGVAYAAGVLGFVLTEELALVFAPPAATLPYLLVGQLLGDGQGAIVVGSAGAGQRGAGSGAATGAGGGDGSGGAGDPSGGSDGSSADGDDTALQPGDLETEPPGHDFSDVGGMSDLKETLRDRVIDPLTRTDVYDHYGIGAVNGVLFHGPPGCGKTYVASAVAGETDYSYLEVTPTNLTSKYIGEAADNVATVFETAREHEPCLVFVDEIDAVAGDRSKRMATSEQQMVNQLLTELESQDDHDVVVFAATNYLEDVDDAILRSGRFDERVEVPPPDSEARRDILALELADAPTADDLQYEPIAEATAGYASSDVELLADVAVRHAIGDESPVGQRHLQQAVAEIDTSIPGWLDRYEDRFEEDLGRGGDAAAVPFSELPGMGDLTAALERRVLDPVRDTERYERHDVDAVDGALLYGPPDAGKTTLARSIAAELDRPVLEISPARFRRESTTDLADRAAEIVEDARDRAPSVLVLDDLDELAPASGGPRERRRLASRLETLLPTLVDDEVLVVGTVSSVGDVHADVLHAGTFDERVEVPPPDPATRAAVLGEALPDGSVASDVDLEAVADATEGFSIRDVRHLAGRVAREALRREEHVTTERLVAEAADVEPTLAQWAPEPVPGGPEGSVLDALRDGS